MAPLLELFFDKEIIMILDFVRSTAEYQGFGFNLLTVGTLLTFIFTIVQGWGVWQQNSTIWRTQSAESVSVIAFGYTFFYFFAFLIFALCEKRLGMLLNSLLGFLYIPLMYGLWKFKGFTRTEMGLLSLFSFMIPIMIVISEKELFLFVLLFGILISLCDQIYTVWITKSPGAVDEKFLKSFMVTNVAWFIYASAVKNWPLQVFNPLSFLILGATLLLCRRYRTITILAL